MKRFTIPFAVILGVAAFSTQAAPPPVAEVFGCNYLEGKGPADLERAITAFKDALPKVDSPELKRMGTNIWTPFRGELPFDFVWSNIGLNLDEWGKASVAWDSSQAGRAADAVFNSVAECPTSWVLAQDILHQSEQPLEDDGEYLLEVYACALAPGRTMADTDAALRVWKTVFARTVKSPAFVLRRVPLFADSHSDLYYLAAWDDPAAYAMSTSAFLADADSSKSNDALNAVHRCTGGLWKSRRIVRAPAP